MQKSHFDIRIPERALREDILALLPRLADFAIPPTRQPEHLWQGDAHLIEDWFADKTDGLHLYCAVDRSGVLAGVALFSQRPELLSDTPSAHLEALAVAKGFEGQGVGSALLATCHTRARELGARSMSLHVFDTNTRAQGLYARHGYETELRRCIKWL